MTQRYRLQFFDKRTSILAINWTNMVPEDAYPGESGDCRVRALTGETNVGEHNKRRYQNQDYTAPITLEEAKAFIESNKKGLGKIHDCVGLTLEDSLTTVEFNEPIRVRNWN